MANELNEVAAAALQLLRKQDSCAALERLDRQEDALEAVQTYASLGNHLYWQQTDLAGFILIARAGIQHGLAAARSIEGENAALALEIRSVVKGMCYDLASFTWPGWDEPGFVIGTQDCAIGLDAARSNLRFAHELKKGDLPLSRGYWILGAQLMAAQKWEEARIQFEQGASHARASGSEAGELLNQAFGHLNSLLASPGDESAQRSLDAIKERLLNLPDGSGFASQVDTAYRVFGSLRR